MHQRLGSFSNDISLTVLSISSISGAREYSMESAKPEAILSQSETDKDIVKDPLEKYESYFEEMRISDPGSIFLDQPRRKVFRMRNSVIKFGLDIGIGEAETMNFIKQNTSIPVPNATSDGPNVIVMDYIEGSTLASCWADTSLEEKTDVARELHDFLEQLRGLRGSYIGAINRQPAMDLRRSSYHGGPFESESAFNHFLVGNMVSSLPSQFSQSLQYAMKTDHEIHFAHADLRLENILIKDGRIVALLDWECAGWFPEYWEFVKFCHVSCSDHTWHDLSSTLFPVTYPMELVSDQFYNFFVF
jgi:hypothetical protein